MKADCRKVDSKASSELHSSLDSFDQLRNVGVTLCCQRRRLNQREHTHWVETAVCIDDTDDRSR